MSLILSLIGRLIVIFWAAVVALMAGSFFIGFVLTSGVLQELSGVDTSAIFYDQRTARTITSGLSVLFGLFTSVHILGFAGLPITLAVAITEMMRWQSVVIHLILGGLCALFVLFTAIELPPRVQYSNGTIIITLASGFVAAGMVVFAWRSEVG